MEPDEACPHAGTEEENVTDRTPADVLGIVESEGVEIVDLRFCDLPGLMQHFSVPAHQLTASAFEEGYGFDGSSIRGFQEIQESDESSERAVVALSVVKPSGDVGAQCLLVDLADLGRGEVVDDLEALRPLEGRHPLRRHRSTNLLQGERGARLQHGVEADALTEVGVGHRDSGDLCNLGEPIDEILDFLGTDLLAATIDHVLVPAFDDEVAVRSTTDDVAAAVPTIGGERPRVLFWGAVVAPRGVRPAGEQRARLTVGDVLVRLVDEAHVVAVTHRPTLGRAHDIIGVVESGVVQQSFRHPEHLLEPDAQRRMHLAGDFVGQSCPTDLEQRQARQLAGTVLARMLQPTLCYGGHSRGDGDSLALDCGKRALRFWRREHDDSAASQQRPQDARTGQGEVVRGRQRHEVHGRWAEPAKLTALPALYA